MRFVLLRDVVHVRKHVGPFLLFGDYFQKLFNKTLLFSQSHSLFLLSLPHSLNRLFIDFYYILHEKSYEICMLLALRDTYLYV